MLGFLIETAKQTTLNPKPCCVTCCMVPSQVSLHNNPCAVDVIWGASPAENFPALDQKPDLSCTVQPSWGVHGGEWGWEDRYYIESFTGTITRIFPLKHQQIIG